MTHSYVINVLWKVDRSHDERKRTHSLSPPLRSTQKLGSEKSRFLYFLIILLPLKCYLKKVHSGTAVHGKVQPLPEGTAVSWRSVRLRDHRLHATQGCFPLARQLEDWAKYFPQTSMQFLEPPL